MNKRMHAGMTVLLVQMIIGSTMAARAVTTTATNSGDWNVAANWDNGAPADGYDVVIPAGKIITNTTATFNLSSLTNSGTLVFTGWDSTLTATNVTVNGTITHLACATNIAPSNTNRVYIACSNLTIDAGGGINVAALGYPGGDGVVAWSSGYGPGGAPGGCGASYGGRGWGGPAPYGFAEAPAAPGSGGGSGNIGTTGGGGGGVVRIEATGAVTVNGIIKADGGIGSDVTGFGGGGSGGSIYIGCRTFTGTRSGINGVISADGYYGGCSGHPGGSGAGGRIALLYNPAAQSSAPMPTVVLSASSYPHGDYEGMSASYVGELGTLYFPDTQLIGETIQHNGQLVITGFTNWSPTNLTLSNAWIRFPDGFNLTVGTNLLATGFHSALDMRYGSLRVGQDYFATNKFKFGQSVFYFGSNSTFRVDRNLTLSNAALRVYADTTNLNGSELVIGGNCVMTGRASLYLHAGMTNATVAHGLTMRMGGNLSLGTGSWIYAYSHITNGGSVFFTMSNLTVSAGGGFNADCLGYAGATNQGSYGWGPGAGGGTIAGQVATGGGYGGAGYGGMGGGTYGSSNAPVDPGSGAGRGIGDAYGGAGGGLVRIEATRTVTLNGTITAEGEDKANYFNAGGSGGGIYIRCRTFAGSGGTLTAQGGDSMGTAGRCAGGGGGRIAVWRQRDQYVGSVATNVAGGVADTPSCSGAPGTVVWGWIPPPGTIFMVH